MASVKGRRVGQSLPRRWIDDLMRASRGRPIVTFERRMALAPLAAIRQQTPIAWSLLFTKAFAIVARHRPELRRAYMPWPWPYFYESDRSHCTFALERDYCGEPAVFFASIDEPANQSLTGLAKYLQRWKTEPVETISDFRHLIRISRFPWFVRRWVWWLAGNVSGKHCVYHFGTFGISVTASTGSTALNLISPVATTLNYGQFDSEHRLSVRLHFDHRMYDGMTAARVLAELEEVLLTEIMAELSGSLSGEGTK